MKKILSIILLSAMVLMLLSGCSGSKDEADTNPNEPNSDTIATTEDLPTEATETTAPTTEPQPVIPEISPDTVGLYIPAGDGTKNRSLVTEFSGSREPKTDIDCFEVLASDEDLVEGDSFTAIWNNAWDAHEDNENAKIGFHIQLELADGETISKNLLKPSDSDEFFEYLEIYMYDDVHQTGWYTHLSDSDMKDETIITSIKLHCGSKISEVGDITLTAFIYNGDDCFDDEGNYIGLVSATVYIPE